MSEIKAADVAKLRKMTGAGMMDCKNALTEANGDFDRAQEIIREKGKLVAAKRADRETTEGAVIALVDVEAKEGVLVALGCETDFVAKTDDFKSLARKIATAALVNLPADKEALENLVIEDLTVAQLISAQTGKSGEKHVLAVYERISGEYLAFYNHLNDKLSTIVAFNKPVPAEVGKDIAMQVTAMNPVSIDRDSVPVEIVKKELEIAVEQIKNDPQMAKKPKDLLEKIALGKLSKFYEENTLLEQSFIKDQKISVAQYLKNTGAEATVTKFVRFSLSE
jgi:elongation factor Ts